MSRCRFFIILFSAVLLAGCVSPGPSAPIDERQALGESRGGNVSTGKDPVKPGQTGEQSSARKNGIVKEMEEFMKEAAAAFSDGKYSQAIRNYLSVLASARFITVKDTDAETLMQQAKTELEILGNSLSLQPQAHWVDAAGLQIEGSSMSAGKDANMNPGVVLTLTAGSGKYIVADAPIKFSFVKGGGKIVESVTTDEYGLANSSIISFTTTNTENVIRASVEFSVPGMTYSFDKVFRDFAYLPPARTATIIVTEKSRLGMSSNPQVLDDTYLALKGISMDFSPYNAVLIGKEFDLLYNGDQKTIERIAKEARASYLIVVMVDCYDVRRMILDGKEYNMFTSYATVNLRIIRASDKRILYSLPVDRIRGQGQSESTAIQDVVRKARSEFALQLKQNISSIERLLAGN